MRGGTDWLSFQGSGPHAGTIVFDLIADPERLGLTVHRASLLRELLALLPEECLHAGKTVDTITSVSSGCIEVVFQDGESTLFDAVIGADGIFGSMRKYVLQDFPDACDPSPAGFWDCRNVVPFGKAKAALGEQYFEKDRQYGWSGDGAFVIHDALEDRTMVQCAVSAIDRDPCQDRKRPLTRKFLEETFSSWMDGSIGKAIIDVSLKTFSLISLVFADSSSCNKHSLFSISPIHRDIRNGNSDQHRPTRKAAFASQAMRPTP